VASPTRPGDKQPTPKRSQARRRLLKSLALGAGAATTATVVPKEWIKPVVDSVVVPLHAQGSPVLSMTCEIDVQDENFSEGSHLASFPLSSDNATDIDDIIIEIDPAVAGVSVHLDIVPIGDSPNDATVEGIDEADQDAVTNDLGQATFTNATYETVTDGIASDGTQGFTATFSGDGVTPCVITVSFPFPP
jgi:hypothetical protein